MTNQTNEPASHVLQKPSGIQNADNENYHALREHLIRSFDEGRTLAENKITESLPFLLEKYYKNRLREDFPSICWGWNLTTRKRVCPQSRFAFIVGAPNSGTTLLF
jgi:hypothetical protein